MMSSMAERPELGPRKSAVLRAVVEEYVRTGEPVGSETIAEHAGLGVSSATIRNELAALEELGFLTHPHTSAGRMTQYAGLAVPPTHSDEPLVRLELIDMGPTVLVLAVGQHGRVDKRVIDRPEGIEAVDLLDAERRLQPLRGLTYPEAQAQLLRMAVEGPRGEHDLMLNVAETLRMGEGAAHVVVGGVANLADEAQQMRRETLRRLFETLEREQEMLRVLNDVSSKADALAVTIGGEHPSTGEWEASIITAPFKAGDATVGTIGLVGPTRMDYLSAMASVKAVAQRLSELATELDQ